MRIPFIDIKLQHKEIKNELNNAIKNAITRGDFILGRDVELFEQEFAKYCGAKFAIGVNSGTDALFLSLLACGIGEGDEVIVPVFTFIATAFAVSYTGAKPVFVDIDARTYNIDPEKIESAITKRTKAIIPVHLFGYPADISLICKIASRHKIKIIEDACQAHGAIYKNKKVGAFGTTGCFSFYPTKNLGAFGDAGIITTNNEKIYKKIRLLRDCGRKKRYEHIVIGHNSRLDNLQAAILRVKLKELDHWNTLRRKNAKIYTSLLNKLGYVTLPYDNDKNCLHVYHQYAVRVGKRDKIMWVMNKNGIGAGVYYPIPLHMQPAYKKLGYKNADFPVAQKIAQDILSLPMHPYLSPKQIEYTVESLKQAIKQKE